MHVTIVTAFSEFFDNFLSTSIVGRAVKAGLLQVDLIDLRSFGRGGYRQIDDYAFGTGGMVLMAEPLLEALAAAKEKRDDGASFVVYPTPQGVPLTQETVETLSRQEHVIIVCGHYEGLDERFVEREVDLEVTVGDCVLTGGEIPAMAIVDAVSRLVPGVVGKSNAVAEDSFYRGMLDHPHYTRPASWEGVDVPPVLLSGDAEKIESWRRSRAVERTLVRRPDLLCRASIAAYVGGGFYVAVLYAADELPGVDEVESMRSSCRSYGAARLFLVFPDRDNREAFRQLLRERPEIQDGIKLMPSLEHAKSWVAEKEKSAEPVLAGETDIVLPNARHWLDLKRFFLEKNAPVIFCFSGGDSEERLGICDVFTTPFGGGREGVCLSLSAKVAVTLDRFLGSK